MTTALERSKNELERITTVSFCDDFIAHVVNWIEEYQKSGKDLRRLAVVFGGKRPSLFVKRELAKRLQKDFFPPRFFTIDELMSYIVRKHGIFTKVMDLDQSYLLYGLAKKHCPEILEGREDFSQFLPWTREILSFIDNLDLEHVSDNRLRQVEANAEIGYAVPQDINRLLEHIIKLRAVYHEHMRSNKSFSRGFQYYFASEKISDTDLSEFDQVLFCNFFYLNKSEESVLKNLFDRKLASFIFQGDERRWPILSRITDRFETPIREGKEVKQPQFRLNLYSAFDGHSQAATVREILKKVPDLKKTVIVLPDPGLIIPLVSEIRPLSNDFNISMGYPLKRSSLYSLLQFIFKAQLSRNDKSYYTRDYLRALRHPLVKNLDIASGSAAERVLVHKLEEMLTGLVENSLAGRLFITLNEIEESDELYRLTEEVLKGMDVAVKSAQLKQTLAEIHRVIFLNWEEITTFKQFSTGMQEFIDCMLEKSFLKSYPLNLKIADKIALFNDEMQSIAFTNEKFPKEDIFKIFEGTIEREIVAFSGSPLKGLQILGLFETRSLSFEHVIVLDANEGVLPRLNVYEPLIPREVMISLNLDRLEQEEEIQRYQFMRLISSAKDVHVVYEESERKERSRFVEELIWETEKREAKLGTAVPAFPSFSVKVSPVTREIRKTPEMIAFLKKHRYSASSINLYLRSPLDFYYNYVLGLREKEDLLVEPENRQIGTFIHEFLETAFKNFLHKQPVFDERFRNYFQKVLDEQFQARFGEGKVTDSFLLKTVMDARTMRFFEHEKMSPERRVKEVLYLEKAFEDKISLTSGEISFIYKVDRIDRLEDGTIMILDYKTGATDVVPKQIEEIEAMPLSLENIREKVVSFQVPLYFHYLDKTFPGQSVNAAYYNLRTLELTKFIDEKMNFERPRINAAFLRALDFVIAEILDPNVPFRNSL